MPDGRAGQRACQPMPAMCQLLAGPRSTEAGRKQSDCSSLPDALSDHSGPAPVHVVSTMKREQSWGPKTGVQTSDILVMDLEQIYITFPALSRGCCGDE